MSFAGSAFSTPKAKKPRMTFGGLTLGLKTEKEGDGSGKKKGKLKKSLSKKEQKAVDARKFKMYKL